MQGTKAPGPDGMPTLFFQHYWETVERPVCMPQFRPIALGHTSAKIISNMLALRLKNYLSSVISDTQSAFVPNQLITDNILLAYEAHHMLKSKKSGKSY
ncbi:hypothetical protein LIER_29946 [Lithospermum erythrorhizon]|uniref:Reverse transcriptase domain-containing protein n=1 Tax=Lithospermum erythrorhizon TaxID=34254 RepID=A0AAV3RL00_LITER